MKKSPVLLFLFRLLGFILILVVMDFIAGTGLKKIYFAQKKGQLAQTTYAIDSAKQDILIFGSSRADRHYSPAILTKGTNLSCYNLGRDAEKIPYYAAVQEVAFKRNRPKLVILDMNANELIANEAKYFKLSLLLPYCDKHPELIKYVEEISPYEKYKIYSKIYPYNSMLFIMLNNLFFGNNIPKDEFGYQPLTGSLTVEQTKNIITRKNAFDEKEKKENRVKIDPKSVSYYKQFLQKTLDSNIKTVVVISPSLVKEPEIYRLQLKEISSAYPNVIFLDYTDDPKYSLQNQKFADMFHLNKQGSEEFSNDLALLLRNKGLLSNQ